MREGRPRITALRAFIRATVLVFLTVAAADRTAAQTAVQTARSELALQRQNVDALKVAQRRLHREVEAGVLSRTDEALVASQLAAARSRLYAAQGQYLSSQAAYLAAIGVEPRTLVAPRGAAKSKSRKR
jgi:outer membrane protein TolC